MIISASRRTDIPAYYSDWFLNRLKDQYVLVRNPMNYNQVSRISLSKKDVECIVFWTKNPYPLFKYIDQLQDYNYYFQFSLTSYDEEIERGLIKKSKLVPVFKHLSNKIGREKVIWRYDPILLSNKITIEDHFNKFELLASKLAGSTNKCIISFLDVYPKIKQRLYSQNIRQLNNNEMKEIAERFSKIANGYNLAIETCSEKIDLSQYDIKHSKCIDDDLIKKLFNFSGKVPKDSNQRLECGCIKSVDIGTYNTCRNGCVYCYANHKKLIDVKQYINSPYIDGVHNDNVKINNRKVDKVFTSQRQFEF
ncbi:DUF1848 domain-containing protein [Clostridiaceae bacterium M8S5]|nr:DUF1848 domain-containing protein [Clostridiaceae bacterium M8S5]